MPQVINTNVASLNAQRNLNQSQNALATSLQRMSSGMRINSAKDDSAGLAISERMKAANSSGGSPPTSEPVLMIWLLISG